MSIEVRDLTKVFKLPSHAPGIGGALKHIIKPQYTEKVAVDHVNFKIDDGEAVAYIGPNGAGKSTTIKMLTGILYPTSGEVRIQGIDPYKDREGNAKNIGVVFGQRTQLWWDIPVVESFRLLKDIYEIPEARYQENLKLFTEVFGLGEFINRTARRLSLGQRMRADLAASLLHDPAVLYLDEPTIGLDITVKENMRQFIRMINKEKGTTIILTSHDLQDIEDLCRRVIVIDDGRIISDVQRDQLQSMYAHERGVRMTLKAPGEKILEELKKNPNLRCEMENPHSITVMFDIHAYTAYEVIHMVGAMAEILDVAIIEPDIKQVIAKIYRSELQVNS